MIPFYNPPIDTTIIRIIDCTPMPNQTLFTVKTPVKSEHRTLYYLSIDTRPNGRAQLYDSRLNQLTTVDFDGVRSFLVEYVNRLKLDVISIHESYLPEKTQLVC